MKRIFVWFWLSLLALPVMAFSAEARVEVDINLSTQRMHVTVNGMPYATWRISSGRRGYYTPRGTYRPTWLKRMHYSRKYDNAPMPYSIFFRGGYAIHGTNVISRLGRPASHGCVRLHPGNAAKLFELVKKYGRKNTIIRITGSTDVAYRNLKPLRRSVARRRTYRKSYRKVKRRAIRRNERRQQRNRAPRFDFLQIYGAMLSR